MNTIKIPAPLTNSQIIEGKICAVLEDLHIKVEIFAAGAGLVRDGWVCDGWRVVLTKESRQDITKHYPSVMFDYYTGTGQRVLPEKDYRVKNLRSLLKTAKETRYKNNLKKNLEALAVPVAPAIAGVLHSLMLDSSAQDENFNNWCGNFGYDQDSIKVLNIYRACLENAEKMARIFSRAELAAISEIVQDY